MPKLKMDKAQSLKQPKLGNRLAEIALTKQKVSKDSSDTIESQMGGGD